MSVVNLLGAWESTLVGVFVDLLIVQCCVEDGCHKSFWMIGFVGDRHYHGFSLLVCCVDWRLR